RRRRDGVRPDLLVAGHRARAVEADDHRTAAPLLAADGVGEEAALDEAPREVATQEGVMERRQLGRQEALEVSPERHLVDLLARTLEGTAAERERLLAHAADESGEPPELGVRREAAAELDLPSRPRPARAA